MSKQALKNPTSPYMPDITYAIASPKVMRMPNTGVKLLTFLSNVQKLLVFRYLLVHWNDSCSNKELNNHWRRDDGGDSQFHEGASVGGKDDSYPVERVWAGGHSCAIEWDLRADKVDVEGHCCPHKFLVESGLKWEELPSLCSLWLLELFLWGVSSGLRIVFSFALKHLLL